MTPTPLGCFPVVGTAAEADAFRAATGVSPRDRVVLPLTFPMRWLAAPAVRGAMMAMVSDDVALVHEAQSFDYQRPLRVDERYTLTLSARREDEPDRLIVHGSVADGDGTPAARMETVLRLFPLQDADSADAVP